MKAYTLTGKEIILKEPALKAGGEGAVYKLDGYDRVVKIYHNKADALAREKKIKEMVKIGNSPSFKQSHIADSIAWPLSPVFDASGDFIGFGMDCIKATKELNDLYVYPPQGSDMSIDERLECLITICDIIGKLHLAGQVFGDFNPNNIKIGTKGTVSFVDADSYHIQSAGGVFKCIVCAPGYVAPEIIKACKRTGSTYENCPGDTFTRESDCFALAIHIFKMLMHGVHPFSCKMQPKRVGSTAAPSTDMNVERGASPFFMNVPGYTVPVFAPDINAFPSYITDLFKRAFITGNTNPKARPTADEWKSALKKYKGELRQCSRKKSHFYWNKTQKCPYCEADKRYNALTVQPVAAAAAVHTKPLVSTSPPKFKPTKPKAQTKASLSFWIVTLLMTVIMTTLLAQFVLPVIYSSADEYAEIIKTVGVVGSVISSIGGCIVYNIYWYRSGKWYEYILSPLTGLGFIAGFGIALMLAIIVIYVILQILAAIFVIAILIGLLSGG